MDFIGDEAPVRNLIGSSGPFVLLDFLGDSDTGIERLVWLETPNRLMLSPFLGVRSERSWSLCPDVLVDFRGDSDTGIERLV
jgi:hypothetical protein